MKKIAIHVVGAIIIFGIGILIGFKIPKKISYQGVLQKDTYQAGWDAAKNRLSQAPGMQGVLQSQEIKDISGTISKVDGNKLEIKIQPLEPLADPNLDTRIVTIDSNTKINLLVSKSSQQLQAEVQQYRDQMANLHANVNNSNNFPEPPASFDIKSGSLSDLKEDQNIEIKTNNDIRNAKEIVAASVDAMVLSTE